MLRKMFSYGGMLLLAGAAFLMTPTSGWAAGHGGGHGGGGHGGGHFGGGHFGGGHFGGARFGGYRGGFYGRGYGYGGWRGYNHRGYGYGYGYGGYYPYYGFGYDYPYGWSGIDDVYGYTGLYAGDTLSDPGLYTFTNPSPNSYQAYYPAATATTPPDVRAHLNVTVPADAQVWFDNTLMKTTGPNREFESPPLTPGAPYTYNVRARWTQNGKEVTQTQKVDVSAGAHVDVTFPAPAKLAAQPAAQK